MAGIDVSVSKELLPGFLGRQDGLAKLAVLNQILQAQVIEALGAERYERSAERTGWRNGHRGRTLYTRVGQVVLLVPPTRDGSASAAGEASTCSCWSMRCTSRAGRMIAS